MGIMDNDRTLPANRRVFEVRRERKLLERVANELEGPLTE